MHYRPQSTKCTKQVTKSINNVFPFQVKVNETEPVFVFRERIKNQYFLFFQSKKKKKEKKIIKSLNLGIKQYLCFFIYPIVIFLSTPVSLKQSRKRVCKSPCQSIYYYVSVLPYIVNMPYKKFSKAITSYYECLLHSPFHTTFPCR